MRAWAVKDTKANYIGFGDLSVEEEIAKARADSLNWSWRTKTRFKAVPVEITEVDTPSDA